MPPARFDNLTDGLLSGVARGDVLYRGASLWNNLPAATAGWVLTTQGPGADPTWSMVSGGMVMPDFILTRAGAATPADPRYMTITPGADTALAASTEANDVLWSLNRTQQFATGALTNQRAVYIRKPTYGFVGASTLTNAATLAIEGAPVAGTNATLTNRWALWVMGDTSRFDGPITCPGAGANSERFGAAAAAAGIQAVALGSGAAAGAGGSSGDIAIGYQATASTGDDAIAIGRLAVATGLTSMAIGWIAQAINTNAFAIGRNCMASGASAFAIGANALASGTSSQAVGQAAQATDTTTLAVGELSTASFTNCISIGSSSQATTGLGNTLIGRSGSLTGAAGYSVGLGYLASDAGFSSVILLGGGATATAANQCLIGSANLSITDLYVGKGVVSGGPAAVLLHATGGSGTNISGASLTLAGGQSTGNAKGGDVLIQTSPAGGAGTGLNALATLAQFTGDSKSGFFGVTPVVQQANASAAGVAGIAAGAAYAQADMVAVKAALTAIRAGMAANGLLANTA